MKSPEWLSKEAKEEFQKIAKSIEVNNGNGELVAILSDLLARYKQIAVEINKDGLICPLSGRVTPLINIQKNIHQSIIQTWKALFGDRQQGESVDFGPLTQIFPHLQRKVN